MSPFRRSLAVFCLFVAMPIAFAGAVLAQDPPTADEWLWSVPAFTGVVDESSLSRFVFHDTGSAAIKSSVASGTVTIRYPVTGGPFESRAWDPALCMFASVRDTGPSARVLVRLKAIRFSTGEQMTLGTIDTDGAVVRPFPPGSEYQRAGTCDFAPPEGSPWPGFNHGEFSYYIEVELIKTAATGNPGIKNLRLSILGG